MSDCAAVYNYLIAQNRDLSTYATSPIWSVVDGPWKLSSFNSDGALTMVQNPTYSGPIPEGKAKEIKEFKEVPFTSNAAEYNTLKAGTSTVQVGFIPPEDITANTTNVNTAGPNQPDHPRHLRCHHRRVHPLRLRRPPRPPASSR